MVGMQNFQDNFETRKRLFISAFSSCMTVPLKIRKKSRMFLRIGLVKYFVIRLFDVIPR